MLWHTFDGVLAASEGLLAAGLGHPLLAGALAGTASRKVAGSWRAVEETRHFIVFEEK